MNLFQRFFILVVIITGQFLLSGLSGSGRGLQNESKLYGRVLSEGKGAPYVTIYIEGSNIGTSTDFNGNFTLKDMPSGKQTLRIQGVGYRSIESEIEIKEGEIKELNFIIEQDVHLIEQVVVSGNRTTGILRYLPGAVNRISGKELKVVSPLCGNEIFRQIAGVHLVDEEGAGLRTNIGVRGLDPDISRNVLILEDGIPVALGPYGELEMYYTPSIDGMNGVEILKGS